MTASISHLDLLRQANILESAAARGDLDAVHTEMCALRNALIAHFHQEADTTASLGAVAGDVVRRGQQRLLRSIDDLLGHSHLQAAECSCISRASRIKEAIARQASLEYHVSRPSR